MSDEQGVREDHRMEKYTPQPTVYFFVNLLVAVCVVIPASYFFGRFLIRQFGDGIGYIPEVILAVPAIIAGIVVYRVLEKICLRWGLPIIK